MKEKLFKINIGSKTQENPNFNPKTQKQTQNPDTCQKPRFTKSGFQKPKMATLPVGGNRNFGSPVLPGPLNGLRPEGPQNSAK